MKKLTQAEKINRAKMEWEEHRLEQEMFRKLMIEKLKKDLEDKKPEPPYEPAAKPFRKPKSSRRKR